MTHPRSSVSQKGPEESQEAGEIRAAAVGFADIVLYSILMSTMAEATHRRWMELLKGVLHPLASRHGSLFFKSTGDGVMAVFSTVADAFAWADAVQRGAVESDRPDVPPVTFRVAIGYGDLQFAEEDVYGHTVNVAARLQQHAPPGGIAITEAAYRLLPHPPDMHDLGPVPLRHIPIPVRARVVAPEQPVRVPRRPPMSGIPSIAVLPLEDLDDDPAHVYFANGVFEDVVISLGALPDMLVLARTATLGWSVRKTDPRIAGSVLGVRYVLSGRMRRRGGGLRLAIDLRETEDGDSIWSDRIEAREQELFDIQDEIVANVVAGIVPSIRAAELRLVLRKRPDSLTAYDFTLRGMHNLDALRHETFAEAGSLLQRAIDEDPGYSMPVAWAAQWHSLAVGQAWSTSPDQDAALAGQMASRAIQLDPRNALGFAIAGHYRSYHLRDPASALPFFEHALQVSPNHALSWTLRSGSLAYLGRGPEALDAAQHGFSLSPHGPHRYYFQCFVGIAHYVCGQEAEAIHWLRLSLRDSPGFTSAHRILMASLVAIDRLDEALSVAADMMRCEPNFRLVDYARERAPFVDAGIREELLTRLRRAGIPE